MHCVAPSSGGQSFEKSCGFPTHSTHGTRPMPDATISTFTGTGSMPFRPR
jgi:hypothetical protein